MIGLVKVHALAEVETSELLKEDGEAFRVVKFVGFLCGLDEEVGCAVDGLGFAKDETCGWFAAAKEGMVL